jgi:hypothetical protein
VDDGDDPDFLVIDSDDSGESEVSQSDLLRLDDPKQIATILSQFSSSSWHPIVRGFQGRYEEDNTWLISGSGRQVQRLREWATTGEPPNDWEEVLGRGFLTDFLGNKEWVVYQCPDCKINI